MSTMKRRELTEEEKQEAAKLSAAWLAYKAEHAGATQTWLGAESKIGSQGAVGQYLRGVIPLNIEALMAISRTIGIDPRAISSRLTNIVDELVGAAMASDASAGGGLAESLKLTSETAGELRVLMAYRLADQAGKLAFDHLVDVTMERLDLERRSDESQGNRS